jgi:hypothetical protein
LTFFFTWFNFWFWLEWDDNLRVGTRIQIYSGNEAMGLRIPLLFIKWGWGWLAWAPRPARFAVAKVGQDTWNLIRSRTTYERHCHTFSRLCRERHRLYWPFTIFSLSEAGRQAGRGRRDVAGGGELPRQKRGRGPVMSRL